MKEKHDPQESVKEFKINFQASAAAADKEKVEKVAFEETQT